MDKTAYIKRVISELGERFHCTFNLEDKTGGSSLYIYDTLRKHRYVRNWAPNEIEEILKRPDPNSEISYDVQIIRERLGISDDEDLLRQVPSYAFRVYFETYARKLEHVDYPKHEHLYTYSEETLYIYDSNENLLALYPPAVFRYMQVVEI